MACIFDGPRGLSLGATRRLGRAMADHAHHAPCAWPRISADFSRAFAIGIALNLAFVLVEAIFGFLANSMALLADAGHNLSDVLGLVVAWAGAVMARRAPSPRFTYGLKKASILAALVNALVPAGRRRGDRRRGHPPAVPSLADRRAAR